MPGFFTFGDSTLMDIVTLSVNDFLDAGVCPSEARKILVYCWGDEKNARLEQIAGRAALNKRDLDNVGLTKENVRLLRYIAQLR